MTKLNFEIVFEYTSVEGDNVVYITIAEKIVRLVYSSGYNILLSTDIIGIKQTA